MKIYQVTVTWSDAGVRQSTRYYNSLEEAREWAKLFIEMQREYTSATYIRTEIREFEFVRDIPVDF